MQQEFHSYAFQLQQGCISTAISSHPKQPIFYTSAIFKQEDPKSILYSLKYIEQSPRKSQLSSYVLNKQITALYPLKEEDPTHIHLSLGGKQNSLALLPYKLDGSENIDEELKIVYKSQEPIIKFLKKNEYEGIICTPSRLVLIDLKTYEEKRELLKLQNEKIGHCAIDPIHQYVTYTINNEIYVFDKGCQKQKYSFKLSPNKKEDIQTIDYNPNKQYYLMSSHPDFIKFWDIRRLNMPVKCLDDHHSLILSAHYNHSHDELLIISYDDGTVGLNRVSSVSSAPSGERQDSMVNLYDQHEDSVYKAEWSGFSPWIFGSVSYGAANMVINTVSEAEKFRILL